MPFLHVDSLALHYEEAGQGPALICIHGWASSARMWEQTLIHLSDRMRVIALDLPGFGDSDKPLDGYSIGYFAETVHRFCHRLDIERAYVIGHSMGGAIAVSLALNGSHFIERLVLVDAAVTGRLGYGLHYALRTHIVRSLLIRTQHAGLGSRWGQQRLERFSHPSFPVVGGLNGVALQRSLEDFSKTTVQSATGSLQAIMNSDLSTRLHLINLPTLIVVGEHDRTIPVSDSLLLAERITGAQLAIVTGANHLPMDERPDLFYPLLDQFLC